MRVFGCELEAATVKSDNEPALVAVVDMVARLRAAKGGIKLAVEHSPVHSSKSNGIIERAVQTVQGMVRTYRDALEIRYEMKVCGAHQFLPWIVEHAAATRSPFVVGEYGRSALQRLKGNDAVMINVNLENASCISNQAQRDGARRAWVGKTEYYTCVAVAG